MAMFLLTAWLCSLSHGRLMVHRIREHGWGQFPGLHISVMFVGHYGSNRLVELFDILNGLRDRVLIASGLMSPAVVVFDVLCSPARFRLDFKTHLALVLELVGPPNHLRAARPARPKLCLAMLAELAPFPVAALVHMLIVEAHDVDKCRYAESVRGQACPGCL